MSLGTLLFLGACSGGGGPPATYDISGTVFAAAGNVIDADVNDPNTADGDNDDFAAAQAITSPAVVGGYVSQIGDTRDYYQVSLTSGQSVRLSLPTPRSSDIELYLYDSVQVLAGSLTGIDERTALLGITADDTYFLEVRAATGASNYKLIVGDTAALTALVAGLSLAHEFVPGQALVRWKSDASAAAAGGRLAMSTATTMDGDRLHLMKFDTPEQMEAVYGQLSMASDRMAAFSIPAADTVMQRKYDTLQIIRALRTREDVESADPNYIRHAYLNPDDPRFDEQWHYQNIKLPQAWDITTGDPDVIVAVVDSGVLLDHPDFAGQLVAGYDFVSSTDMANDDDGRDADPDDPGDGLDDNSSFHGTHVAGTVAAAWNNGLGVAGVGGVTKIMPVRVLGVGGGADSDIIAGIRYAADATTSGPRPDRRADIINLSLGGPGRSSALDSAVAAARAAGVIVVVAAGNSTSSQPEYPASSPGAISVAATDINNHRAYYTNFGAFIDVAAPGGDRGVDLDGSGDNDTILSTGGSDTKGFIENIYLYAQGTSMSSPHVAGVAALMKAVRPGLTPDEFDAYLASGAITTELDDSGLGAGLIDALAAVQAAGAGGPPTVLKAVPNALSFEYDVDRASMELVKLGSGGISGVSVSIDPPGAWLAVTPLSVDGDDLGTYTVAVDRTGVSGGIHTAVIQVTSAVNTIQVPVRMEVLPDTTANAGQQYILVVNAANLALVDKQPMTFANGQYTFSVSGLRSGSYELYAGTDLDGDGRSLDAGEAFGTYPSADRQRSLNVFRDIQGISFPSGFSLDPFVTANQHIGE